MARIPFWLTAVVVASLVLARFEADSGFLALLRFGDNFAQTRLPEVNASRPPTVPGSGYDGQFYAQLALDPSLQNPALAAALDAPAYRARRILAPLAAYMAGLGHPPWVLQAYALINVLCWAVLALALFKEIDPSTRYAFARWFACVCSLGVLDSVRQSLVDLPALVLLVVALRCRPPLPSWASAVWLAAGNLAKETNLLATLAIHATPGARFRHWGIGLTASLPIAGWILYVNHALPSSDSGLGNFTWPLFGAFAQLKLSLRSVIDGANDSRHAFALLAIPGLFLQATAVVALRSPDRPWWRIGVAYAALLTVLGPWVWSGYWAACRAVLPLTIAFNLLLPANRAFWPLWLLGNISIFHGVWRFL